MINQIQTNSRQVHEDGKLVLGDIAAPTRHPAPPCFVVHHLDIAFPRVNIPPILLLENPGSRYQGLEVLSTMDLSNKMSRIQNLFNLMHIRMKLPMKYIIPSVTSQDSYAALSFDDI